MDKLIPLMNKIQSALSTVSDQDFDAKLPQIVVVGEQSAGKSSVLESIIRRPCLPRGSDIVTRCPVIIRLVKVKSVGDLPIYKGKKKEETLEKHVTAVAEFEHLPEDQRFVVDFEAIPGIINKEVDKRTGHKKNIIKKELVMTIYSPEVVTLTLVDLPGLVKVRVEGQDEGIIGQINHMITQYIGNPNAIILAVSSATADVAASDAIAWAKKVDPNLDRTVAVFTKLDLVDEGLEQNTTDLLEGRKFRVKMGIVGVVNRNFKETERNVTITDAWKKEQDFFRKKYPKLAEKHGVCALRNMLQNTLAHHIKKVLPDLNANLRERKMQAEKELDAIGDCDPKDTHLLMLNIIDDVCRTFSEELQGESAVDDDLDEVCGRAKIASILDGKLRSSIPPVQLKAQKIIRVVENTKLLDATLIVPEPAFKKLAATQMKKLAEPAEDCAEEVRTELVLLVDKALDLTPELGRFPHLRATLAAEIEDLLNDHHKEAVREVKKYIERNAAWIKTVNPEFNSVVQEFCPKGKSHDQLQVLSQLARNAGLMASGSSNLFESSDIGPLDENQRVQCYAVMMLVSKYYEIRTGEFLDYIPKVVMGNLVVDVVKDMRRFLIGKMNDKVDELMQEDEGITERRAMLGNLVKALTKAERALREAQGTKI